MDADLDTLATALYVEIDDLIDRARGRGRRPLLSHAELLCLAVMQVLLVNAMAYWLRAGCAWRLLPHDLPPWQTVYHYFRCWRQQGLWEQITIGCRSRNASGKAGRPPQRSHPGQPEHQDHRTGGRTATTAPSGSTAASATCWSTPSAWSARSRDRG